MKIPVQEGTSAFMTDELATKLPSGKRTTKFIESHANDLWFDGPAFVEEFDPQLTRVSSMQELRWRRPPFLEQSAAAIARREAKCTKHDKKIHFFTGWEIKDNKTEVVCLEALYPRTDGKYNTQENKLTVEMINKSYLEARGINGPQLVSPKLTTGEPQAGACFRAITALQDRSKRTNLGEFPTEGTGGEWGPSRESKIFWNVLLNKCTEGTIRQHLTHALTFEHWSSNTKYWKITFQGHPSSDQSGHNQQWKGDYERTPMNERLEADIRHSQRLAGTSTAQQWWTSRWLCRFLQRSTKLWSRWQ